MVLLACFFSAQLSQCFPAVSPHTAVLAPQVGVALAFFVLWGSGVAPAAATGLLLATLTLDLAPGTAAALAAAQLVGPWIASRWLNQAGFNHRVEQGRDLVLLVGVGGLTSGMISASLGLIGLAAAGIVGAPDLAVAWLRTGLAQALGVLLFAPPILGLAGADWARAPSRGNATTTTALLSATAAAGALAVGLAPVIGPPALAWLALPPVLVCWLSLRAGLPLASLGAAVLSSVLLAAAQGAFGPGVGVAGASAVPLGAYAAALAALALTPHVMQGELARREARWQHALVGSDLGVADWNLRTGQGYTSPRWRALLDDPQGLQTGTIDGWLAHVHPEDREALRSVLAPMANPAGGANAGVRHEARVQVRDGWCWFDVHVTVVERTAAGAPLRVVASLADIGARRSAEDRQQLSSNLFQHLHEGLLITDAEFRIVDVNPTYCRITGMARDELLGTVPSLLMPTAPDSMNLQQQASLWSALRTHGHWVGELVERRRSGDPCALHVTVSSVQGPEGALRYYVLVVSDVTEQRLQRERLERQASFDELTRLPNRARLRQLLLDAMASTDREGQLLAVCYLDVDHFKAVNERHGHATGDRLLTELAMRLRTALRSRGTSWSDVAARLGGDEFALLVSARSVDEARAAVERVLRVVAQPFHVAPAHNDPLIVSASIGVTLYPMDASDGDTLLRHADQAMYGAKQAGRNGFLFFDPELSRRTEERVMAIGRVQDALDHEELVLHFQPKVDLQRGAVLGFEALVRWNHPEHGLVPPAQFMPLIEHTGLSSRIGDHVLAQALEHLDAWVAQGLDLTVSVNISARHLQEPDFAQRLAELLARHSRALGPRLELEVLETAALTDIAFTSALLERCARLGVRWALDDFGTGYSTLTYLKQLPVQVLKIDRSFVHNMLADAQDRAIVEGVISLARTFDCVAVAEGIETPAQARMLLDMGCDIGQGTGIASAMPATEVPAWVRSWRGLFALAAAPAGGLVAGPAAGLAQAAD